MGWRAGEKAGIDRPAWGVVKYEGTGAGAAAADGDCGGVEDQADGFTARWTVRESSFDCEGFGINFD